MTLSTDETTVRGDDVAVTRHLRMRDEKIICRIEIQPISQKPEAMVHVVDEFPHFLPIDAVGFKSDLKPDDGDISLHQVSIKQTVETEPVEIVYGIKLAEPVESVEFDAPTVQEVDIGNMVEEAGPYIDNSGPSSTTSDEDGVSSLFESGRPSRDRNSAVGARDSETQSPDIGSDPPTTQTRETDPSATDGASFEEIEEAINQADQEAPTDRVNRDRRSGSAGTDAHLGGSATTDEDEVDTESEHAVEVDASDSAASKGANEGGEVGEIGRRSIDIRLDRLSARVEELTAYSTALEEFIDTNDTAADFIERTERELAEMDTRIQGIRGQVDTIRNSHDGDVDALQERIDTLEARLAGFHSNIETDVDEVRDRTDGVEAQLGKVDETLERTDRELTAHGETLTHIEETLEGLDDRIARVEDDLDDVRSIRTEVESLKTVVNDLTDFRESIIQAVEGPTGSGGPEDQK